MSIRDVADRAAEHEDHEPEDVLGETDTLPLELTVRENGSMTEFSLPVTGGGDVNDALQWCAITSEFVVDLEVWR